VAENRDFFDVGVIRFDERFGFASTRERCGFPGTFFSPAACLFNLRLAFFFERLM